MSKADSFHRPLLAGIRISNAISEKSDTQTFSYGLTAENICTSIIYDAVRMLQGGASE